MKIIDKKFFTLRGAAVLVSALGIFTGGIARAEEEYKSQTVMNPENVSTESRVLSAPPPVGPFQVAQPRIHIPPNPPREPVKAPSAIKMNQKSPQMPKSINRDMKAPVNNLLKPVAPVQKFPEGFSVPLMMPQIQRYMYVPVPIPVPPPVSPQAPQLPAAGDTFMGEKIQTLDKSTPQVKIKAKQ